MGKLTCNVCLKTKDEAEFNWRWKALGIKQRRCRECQHIQQNDWYARNKEFHKKKMVAQKQRVRQETRQYVENYLATHPCVDCGESDLAVLEFDHVRGFKKYNISYMLRSGYGVTAVEKEIAKCDIRCANCHRKKHKKEGWSVERKRLPR
jgi:hypothetical protein